jgi:hypothetical protein
MSLIMGILLGYTLTAVIYGIIGDKMSRKNYEVAAKQISMIMDNDMRSNVRLEFAAFFANDNPRFDRNRFFDRIESYVVKRLRGK